MASVMSDTIIVGNIGNVYELRQSRNGGDASIEFTVAVTRKSQVDGEWKDKPTIWHTVKAWGVLAENLEKSLTKGDRVIVHTRVDLRPAGKSADGTEYAEKLYLTANYVGLELTYNPARSERKPAGDRQRSESPARSERSQAPARKAPAAQSNDFDDLDDLGLDDDVAF